MNRDVQFWHLSDMCRLARDVGCWRQSGHGTLAERLPLVTQGVHFLSPTDRLQSNDVSDTRSNRQGRVNPNLFGRLFHGYVGQLAYDEANVFVGVLNLQSNVCLCGVEEY